VMNALLRRERPGSPATVTVSRCGMPHLRASPLMPRRSPRRKHPVAFDAIDDGYVELLLDLLWPSSLGALLHFL